MKKLLIPALALFTLSLLGSAALASPGDRYGDRGDRYDDRSDDRRGDRGDRGDRYDDDRGYEDDYDEARTYYVPDFDRRVQRGITFHEIRRHLRGQMRARVAQKTRMIHARHGFGHRAARKISRMEAREFERFQSRLAWAQARFDRMRHARYQSAPTYASTPVYVPAPGYAEPAPCHGSGDRY